MSHHGNGKLKQMSDKRMRRLIFVVIGRLNDFTKSGLIIGNRGGRICKIIIVKITISIILILVDLYFLPYTEDFYIKSFLLQIPD